MNHTLEGDTLQDNCTVHVCAMYLRPGESSNFGDPNIFLSYPSWAVPQPRGLASSTAHTSKTLGPTLGPK